MNKTLHTKFGTAKLQKDGYYVITSWKEGNNRKKLHRLIWEDFYNCEVPEGYVIHHRNFDKLDNCILNLQLMRISDHLSLHKKGENHHMYNKHHSEESKRKIAESMKGENNPMYGRTGENNPNWNKKHSDERMENESKSRNTTGYFRVSKCKNKQLKQGFRWKYTYYKDGKRKFISSVSIDKLEAKVRAKGLIWKKLKGGD